MPTGSHFVRDHFGIPAVDLAGWRLKVVGAVTDQLSLSLQDLGLFAKHRLNVVLECAGHRRAEHAPNVRGIQWGVGAVSEAEWVGIRLSDVLGEASPRGHYVVLEGIDQGAYDGAGVVSYARAIPLEKALHGDTLLAWGMNDEPLPPEHGAPLRAIVPGWYATDSVKWLHRILVTAEPFMGPFEARDYRIEDSSGTSSRLTALPVHSLLTSVGDHGMLCEGETALRGIAWGGSGGVARVEVSVDGGPWAEATLAPSHARYSRSHWSFAWAAQPGVHTITIRATDASGVAQPDEPCWNAGGYANASTQRVRIAVN